MRNMGSVMVFSFLLGLLMLACYPEVTEGQLSPNFYETTCPNVSSIVSQVVVQAIAQETRMAASLLRLHFHDCFVQGCDASLLIDNPSGEQTAPPNLNSARGFEVIDNIKSALESACPGIVSCADILALTAEISVKTVGGPSWTVPLGRRDSTTFATTAQVLSGIPAPNDTLDVIITKFSNVGLSTQDVVILSGSHTIGRARCVSFQDRLYNFSGTGSPDPTIDPSYLASLQALCPEGGDGTSTTILEDLDQATGNVFDNRYYYDLQINRGLLQSDQSLYSTSLGATSTTSSLVNSYSSNQDDFFADFSTSMISMGNINPLTGSSGQIRLSCGQVNS